MPSVSIADPLLRRLPHEPLAFDLFGQVAGGAAIVLWGLGASLGFPVALSAAGASGPNSVARVSFVATLGYVAFPVGPPVLGFLGEHYGLRNALIAPLALVVAAAFLAPQIVRRRAQLHESSTR